MGSNQQLVSCFKAASGSSLPTTNLVENLDASTLSGSDGTDITTWVATTGKNATGTVALTGKVYNAVKNSLNVIRFDGIVDTMTTVNFDSRVDQPFVIIVVFKLNAQPPFQRFLSSNNNSTPRAILRYSDDPWYEAYAGSAFERLLTTSNPDTSWHIQSIEINGASSKMRVDGGTEQTTGNDPGTTGGLDGLTISGDYDGTINPTSVDVGQILIYTGAIADKTAHFAYLNGKWAVY